MDEADAKPALEMLQLLGMRYAQERIERGRRSSSNRRWIGHRGPRQPTPLLAGRRKAGRQASACASISTSEPSPRAFVAAHGLRRAAHAQVKATLSMQFRCGKSA